MKNYLLIATFLLSTVVNARDFFVDETSSEQLCRLINENRHAYHLDRVPMSQALMYTAEIHLRDLSASPPESPCLNNSWSNNSPDYQACCYRGIQDLNCMQNKPAQLTQKLPDAIHRFQGKAYEITFWGCNDPKCVRDALVSNPETRPVLLNDDSSNWGGTFGSIGCANHPESNYSTVWVSYSHGLPYLGCLPDLPTITGDKLSPRPELMCSNVVKDGVTNQHPDLNLEACEAKVENITTINIVLIVLCVLLSLFLGFVSMRHYCSDSCHPIQIV